jgi:ParB-like chromosome segregation protein Spo0J
MGSLLTAAIIERAKELCAEIASLPEADAIETINAIKVNLHAVSPMREEPVDCVIWVPADTVEANDYNPNAVAPPEMKLLAHSISEDGYTQPIVTWRVNGHHEVVDGFHRNRVGKENKAVRKRARNHLPVVAINSGREDRSDRIAATIRHNRARGKHQVAAMSEIVVELKRRNWSDDKIGRELGMEPDEVLRLAQISGLAEMFADREFSEAWEVEYAND